MRGTRANLMDRAAMLGAASRGLESHHETGDAARDAAWDAAWLRLSEEFGDRHGIPRPVHDDARAAFLEAFRPPDRGVTAS